MQGLIHLTLNVTPPSPRQIPGAGGAVLNLTWPDNPKMLKTHGNQDDTVTNLDTDDDWISSVHLFFRYRIDSKLDSKLFVR